jgi:hypothetical protein
MKRFKIIIGASPLTCKWYFVDGLTKQHFDEADSIVDRFGEILMYNKQQTYYGEMTYANL